MSTANSPGGGHPPCPSVPAGSPSGQVARDVAALVRAARHLREAIGALSSVAVHYPGCVARVRKALLSELRAIEELLS